MLQIDCIQLLESDYKYYFLNCINLIAQKCLHTMALLTLYLFGSFVCLVRLLIITYKNFHAFLQFWQMIAYLLFLESGLVCVFCTEILEQINP